MYSDKKNVLQLAALLKEHEIRNVVLCPGSRNIPIVQTLARHPFFTCHAVTDERNAGFFAIGLALNSGKPAALPERRCLTSIRLWRRRITSRFRWWSSLPTVPQRG